MISEFQDKQLMTCILWDTDQNCEEIRFDISAFHHTFRSTAALKHPKDALNMKRPSSSI